MAMRFSVVLEGVEYPVEVSNGSVTVGESTYKTKVEAKRDFFKVSLGRKSYEFKIEGRTLSLGGEPLEVLFEGFGNDSGGMRPGRKRVPALVGGVVRAPMPGRVVSVAVRVGDPVPLGAPLLILEAMKMQNEIPSPVKGTVKEVRVTPDTIVGKEEILMVLQPVLPPAEGSGQP